VIHWPTEIILTAGYVLAFLGQWRISSGKRDGFLLNMIGTFAGISVGLYLHVWSIAFWSTVRLIPNARGFLRRQRGAEMKVYVAGPYTKGDVALNVRAAIEAADRLLKAGYVPFLPHVTHFWHLVCPGPYEQWIAYDLEWLPSCQALVRLPGESAGADGEVARARELGIPVFEGVEAFLNRAA
jgi:hypothetical protein